MKCLKCGIELNAANSDFQIAMSFHLCKNCDTQESRLEIFNKDFCKKNN